MRKIQGDARAIDRMEASSDAAFAVAAVAPVVQLRIAWAGVGAGAGADGLRQAWPALLAYGLSTLIIALYWARQRFLCRLHLQADRRSALLNLPFLAAVGLIPLAAHAFAERADLPNEARLGAAALAGALALAALAWLGRWLYGLAAGMVDRRLDPAWLRRLTRRYALSCVGGLAAVALAALDWRAGLALGVLAAVAVPPFAAPVYLEGVEEIRRRRRSGEAEARPGATATPRSPPGPS